MHGQSSLERTLAAAYNGERGYCTSNYYTAAYASIAYAQQHSNIPLFLYASTLHHIAYTDISHSIVRATLPPGLRLEYVYVSAYRFAFSSAHSPSLHALCESACRLERAPKHWTLFLLSLSRWLSLRQANYNVTCKRAAERE